MKNELKCIRKTALLPLTIGVALMLSPIVNAQSLTSEQMTQRIKVLSNNASQSNKKLDNLEKGLKSVQQEVTKIGRLIDNRAMIEMLQRVDNLSEEISLLRGETEQQGHDVSEIKKRQRELYLDIDRRLRDLENRATSQNSSSQSVPLPSVAAPAITPTPESTAGSTGTSVETPEVSSNSQPEPGATLNTSQSTSTSSEESAAYQAAFDTLKEGRYKRAKTEFKTFLQKYPDSSYAGNAQYWLGEANYVTRHFEQGIIEFKLVLTKYSSSSKVPDAMLKLGYTYYEMKQFDQSKMILEELSNRFPKTTAARLGGKRLDRIRKEGH